VKIMVAIIVATGMVLVMAQHGAGFKACTVVYMCVGVMMCAILGVFGEERKVGTKYGSIRHRDGRSYGQAA